MGWPQWIFLILSLLGMMAEAAKYGRKNHSNNNTPNYIGGLLGAIFSNAIMLFIVYWGGFFDG